jgi:hypothetical protein
MQHGPERARTMAELLEKLANSGVGPNFTPPPNFDKLSDLL